MKHKKKLSCLMGATLAFAGAVAGVGCVMTGFGMQIMMSLPWVILALVCWSAVAAALLMLPHGGKWLTAVSVLVAATLLWNEEVRLQVEFFLNRLSYVYNAAYGWGEIHWSEGTLQDIPVTWGMIFLGGLSATGICWSVCRRKWLAVGLVTGILPLILCCVVTDTVPAEGYLFLLLSVLVLMALPHLAGQIRKDNGIRLTAMLLIPVLLLMTLLFGQVKQDGFEMQSGKLQQAITELLHKLPFGNNGPGINVGVSVGGITIDRVDLAEVGPQVRQRHAVMDVVAPATKTLYLRGQALDQYDGKSWSLGPGADQTDLFWPQRGLLSYGEIEIAPRTLLPMKYLPYYTGRSMTEQEDGMTAQQKMRTPEDRYQTELWLPYDGESLSSGNFSFRGGVEAYLSLPDSTRLGAESILREILTDEETMAEKAETIRYYVETSAEYDLNTQQMPEGESDFALWFLEESDSGYCVHFASAAAVLLRAAGIPARYVSGYTVNAIRNRRVTVTAEQAHAWVEYLDEDYSWKVLEATPTDWRNAQPRPTVPHPTEEDTQSSTEDTTETQESTGDTGLTTQPANESTQPEGNETQPTGNQSPQQQTKSDLGWLWGLLKTVGWTVLAIGVIMLQYALRLRHRRKAMYTGTTNRQAICRWRYGKQLARRMRCALPERLDVLAEKAAYSQHRLTAQELAEFDAWLETKHKELSHWPVLSKLFVKFIFSIG